MRHVLLSCLLLLTLGSLGLVSGADDPRTAALQMADDARVTAFLAADAGPLQELLADDLRYAHSSGAVDNKASLIAAMTGGKLKYTGMTYQERNFTFPAEGIALMSGRVRLQVSTANGPVDFTAGYLAVWREEKGKWHFLAWQSAKLPEPAK